MPKKETKQEEEETKRGAKQEQQAIVKQEETNSAAEEEINYDEDELNWWEQENLRIAGRGEKRWDTLSHNGVLFPPPYVPHGIPILYDGKTFAMTPEEEEVATMFAVMREHDYYRNETFRRNFFISWREILDRREHPIRRLELCNFDAIYQWYLAEREKKLAMTKEEKKQIKQAAAKEAELYRYCVWDGRREEVARYRVEPPGLFRGRGKHPLMGKLKARVQPEDITLNLGEEAPVPVPPAGHHWAAVQHDHTVTWLAMWRDNVTGNFKYVMPAPSSTIKGQSDMMKFEKARKLKEHVDRIRAAYMEDFKSKDTHVAQRAVAMYFIDRLALRVGNEKGSEEADTVGCCSLRVEHLQLMPNNVIHFDFLGKDSIRYQNDVTVLPEVYALVARFMRHKKPRKDIFDQLTPTQLNDHLKSFMEGLSAKVFRTYNASITLDRLLREQPVHAELSVAEKLTYFNKANTEVAILCNHQKTVSKNFANQMMQLNAKASNTRAILAALEKARQMAKTQSIEAAAREFFAEQDRVQRDWLEAYGTEEQKKEYEEIVAKRGLPQGRAPHSRGKADAVTTTATKTRSKQSRSKHAKGGSKKDTKNGKGSSRRTRTASSSSRTKRTRNDRNNNGDNDSSEDDEGETIANLAAKLIKKETRSRKRAKRERVAKKETVLNDDGDDDDVPLSSLCN